MNIAFSFLQAQLLCCYLLNRMLVMETPVYYLREVIMKRILLLILAIFSLTTATLATQMSVVAEVFSAT
jgi:hypothetical protein